MATPSLSVLPVTTAGSDNRFVWTRRQAAAGIALRAGAARVRPRFLPRAPGTNSASGGSGRALIGEPAGSGDGWVAAPKRGIARNRRSTT